MSSTVERISSNKTTSTFVSENNIDLLWNIIIQNNAFQTSIDSQGKDGKQKLRAYYISKVKTFVETNLTTTSTVIDFNKQFIAFFIRGFQSNSLNDTDVAKPIKLQINNNDPLGKEAITVEEIKSERLSEFDQKYKEVQQNFDLYRNNDTPSNVEFSDTTADEPFEAKEFQKHVTSRLENRKIDENIFVERVSTTLHRPDQNNLDMVKWLNLKELPIPSDVSQKSSNAMDAGATTKSTANELLARDNRNIDLSVTSSPVHTYSHNEMAFTAAIESLQTRMISIETNVDNLCQLIQRYIRTDDIGHNTKLTTPNMKNEPIVSNNTDAVVGMKIDITDYTLEQQHFDVHDTSEFIAGDNIHVIEKNKQPIHEKEVAESFFKS